MKQISFAAVLLLSILQFCPSSSNAETNLEYLGFHLAYPTSIPKYEHTYRITMKEALHYARFVLTIDEAGHLENVMLEKAADSVFADYLDNFLKSWKWSPATLEGVVCKSRVEVAVLFKAGLLSGDIIYPGHPAASDAVDDLKLESFRLNGIEPPCLIKFPSLSLLVDKSDTSNFCAFAAFNVSLDSAGRVLSSQVIGTNSPKYLAKLSTALLWAELDPANVNGRAVGSNIIIAFTINRNLSYPSVVWKSCCLGELNLLQRESVRLLLDTAGYIIPPIPQLPPGDTLKLGRGYKMTSDQILCGIEIGPSGKRHWDIYSRVPQNDVRVVKLARKNIRFFPAIGSDGKPATFSGYAIIRKLDSRTIRIEYSWLNGGRLSSPSDKYK